MIDILMPKSVPDGDVSGEVVLDAGGRDGHGVEEGCDPAGEEQQEDIPPPHPDFG